MRSGIRIRGARGHPEVRDALVRYAVWLRRQYEFPIRVPVYLSPREAIVTMHGHKVSASFFAPWNQREEPYIRLATGDYPALKRECGRDDALAAFINSLSHEVVHYQQWVETGEVWERGVGVRATGMLRRYARDVDRP